MNTIRDVAKSVDAEVTEDDMKEIYEEIFFTEEWASVMSKIADMMYAMKK